MNISDHFKILVDYFKNNEFIKVIEVCEKIIKIDSNIAEAYNFYGLALQKQKKNKQAINYFNKAISIEPKDFSAFNNLANSYKSLFLNELAYKNYEKSLEINPKYLQAVINFAVLKKELNDHNGSIKLFKTALELKPNHNKEKILFSLAELYEQKGEIENSKNILEKILKLNKFNSAAHYMLSKYLNYKNENNHHIEMETLLKNKKLSDDEIVNFSFALGKAFEEKNEHEKSFNFYKHANDTKRKLFFYDLNYFNNLKTILINYFEKYNIPKINKYNDKKIIFICGMPRSGTTLVEQIISSHKNVEASGETSILSIILEKQIIGTLKSNNEKIKSIILSDGNNIKNYYYKRLSNLNINKQIITDKTVQNFIWIGFIISLFPNCKIINCSRDSKDICFSIYKNNFKSSFMNWGYKQEEIANFFNFYSDLMKFWNYKFPNEIYNIKYENLLNNSSNEIKKLINFCEIEWDRECLSNIQVPMPSNNTSKNLYKNYSKFLFPMLNLLRN